MCNLDKQKTYVCLQNVSGNKRKDTKMIIRLILILFPLALLGQSKNCNTFQAAEKPIYCLIDSKTMKNDTTIFYRPNKCNTYNFDKTANGIYKIYTADSILINIIQTKDGKKHGNFLSYHSNGQIEIKSKYNNDKIEGEFISFYRNGAVNNKGFYYKEAFTGTISTYWDNEKIAKRSNLKKGTWKDECWDKDGNPIDERTFDKLWFDCK